jgi:hypothetical protein
LFHLPRGGLGEILAAVTERYVPQTGKPIDVLFAVGVAQTGALAGNPDERLLVIIRMKLRMS